MKLVIASGYFNPIRPVHIEYLSLAKNIGDRLIVIINNDEQIKLKKETPFMNEADRRYIVQSLKCVDGTVLSIDQDSSVSNTIKNIYEHYTGLGYAFNKDAFYSITFAKSGNRYANEIPESKICKELGIKIVDSLGNKDCFYKDVSNVRL